jgi:hypothetical protein
MPQLATNGDVGRRELAIHAADSPCPVGSGTSWDARPQSHCPFCDSNDYHGAGAPLSQSTAQQITADKGPTMSRIVYRSQSGIFEAAFLAPAEEIERAAQAAVAAAGELGVRHLPALNQERRPVLKADRSWSPCRSPERDCCRSRTRLKRGKCSKMQPSY